MYTAGAELYDKQYMQHVFMPELRTLGRNFSYKVQQHYTKQA